MSTDPDHIEERIEDTRARLSQNLGELGDRMSPGNLMDEALRYFDTGPKEFAGSLGNQVRENPMGALLTAAGVAWMAMGRGQDPVRRYTDPRARGYAASESYYDARYERDDDDDDDYDDRTYSRLDTDHIPDGSGSTTHGGGERRDFADTGADYSEAETGIYQGRYDLPDAEVTTYRSTIDTYDTVSRLRTQTPRNENEIDSDYYRRLDDTYASTLKIERNEGEDDDTYRARVRAAVDTAGDKAREARRTLKQSARRARSRLMEMRRNAGQSAADFRDEASRRAGMMGDRMSEFGDEASRRAAMMGDRASEFGDDASRYAAEMRDEAAYRARMAKRRAGEFHDENPLVSGVLALAAGALAGALFPVSEKEREALRPVADDLIERGAALAEEGADRVEAYAGMVEDKAEELRDEPLPKMGGTTA